MLLLDRAPLSEHHVLDALLPRSRHGRRARAAGRARRGPRARLPAAHAGVQLQRRRRRRPPRGGRRIPGTVGYCLSVRREPLDFILVKRARAAEAVDFADRAKVSRPSVGRRSRGGSAARRWPQRARRDRRRRRRSQLPRREEGEARGRARDAAIPRPLLPLRQRVRSDPTAPNPDAAEFSQLGDELAYIFPSDSGLTCVAVSVNLETFRWLRQDFEERYAERIAGHRGLASRVAAAEMDGRLAGCGPAAQLGTCAMGAGLGARRRRRHASGPVERARHRHGRCARDLPGRCHRRLAEADRPGSALPSPATTSAAMSRGSNSITRP